jgi:SAM-dependent methyltransferase
MTRPAVRRERLALSRDFSLGPDPKEASVKDEPAQPGRLAVLGMRLRNTLIRRYSSRGARRYEARRRSARWAAEAAAFERVYARINPKSVLDLPVGTGRFFPAYAKNGASVLGVDISNNMLAEAAGKIPPGASIRLEQADVLDLKQPSPLGSGYDLIVCMRFVYWLRPTELAIMLGKFHATAAPFLVVSTKVALDEKQRRQRKSGDGWVRSLRRLRAHLYRSVVKRVYRESDLLDIFQASGWILLESHPLLTTRSVRYLCYLFGRNAGDRQKPDE